MSKRELLLNAVFNEGALYGKGTQESMRLYVEHRLSYPAYIEALRKGIKVFKQKKVS